MAARADTGAEMGPARHRTGPKRPHPPDDVGSTAGMLPRPRRPHDQLLRAIWVAGIGGLVVGHILWLAGISIAIATQSVSTWVLVVAAVSFVAGAGAARFRWGADKQTTQIWGAVLLGPPRFPGVLC